MFGFCYLSGRTAIWALLGRSLGRLGRSWGGLGGLLEPWRPFGRSRGGIGGLLGALGTNLEGSWALLGPSWERLGSSWARLGSFWRALGAVLAASCVLLRPSWARLESSWQRVADLAIFIIFLMDFLIFSRSRGLFWRHLGTLEGILGLSKSS